jgi:hypothetical protein
MQAKRQHTKQQQQLHLLCHGALASSRHAAGVQQKRRSQNQQMATAVQGAALLVM